MDEANQGNVEVHVTLSRETVDAIKRLAEMTGTTAANAISSSVNVNKYLVDAENNGELILIREKDGNLVRFVRRR